METLLQSRTTPTDTQLTLTDTLPTPTTMTAGPRRPLLQETSHDDQASTDQASSSPTGPRSQPSTPAPTFSAFPAVSFPINSKSPDGRILWVGDAASPFDYFLNESIVPSKIGWYFEPDPAQSQEYRLLDDAAFVRRNDGGSDSPSTSQFLLDVSRYNVKLNLSALRVKTDMATDLSSFVKRQDDTRNESRLRKKMVVRIYWTATSGSVGYSQSGVFTVAQFPDARLASMVKEWIDEPGGRNGTEGTMSEGPSARAGTGGVPTGGGEGQPSPNSQPAQGLQGVGGGGGLSTGAIVGIAVGAGLALVLVAGLAWLLLRWRRQKKRGSACAATRLTSKTSVEDKYMQATRAIDSPRSPFSNEGTPSQNQGSPVTPLAATSHGEGGDDQAGFAPHDADATALRSSHADAGRHEDRAQARRGVSTSVAHLVEEGMTPEEIRRLEDEEWQLDAEIERAARR